MVSRRKLCWYSKKHISMITQSIIKSLPINHIYSSRKCDCAWFKTHVREIKRVENALSQWCLKTEPTEVRFRVPQPRWILHSLSRSLWCVLSWFRAVECFKTMRNRRISKSRCILWVNFSKSNKNSSRYTNLKSEQKVENLNSFRREILD